MKIEAGKTYRMRNGGKAGPMEPANKEKVNPLYGFSASVGNNQEHHWCADGSYWASRKEDERDIAAEWTDQAPEATIADSCAAAASRDSLQWKAEADQLRQQLQELSKQLTKEKDEHAKAVAALRINRVVMDLARRAIEEGAFTDAATVLALHR